MSDSRSPHVIIFPFMAQGHIIPVLDLAKCLTMRDLRITIISTPLNSHFIETQVKSFAGISLSVIPFPQVPYLPKGCENVSALPSLDLLVPFIQAVTLFREPFEDILQKMHDSSSLPLCVISDYFLGWTLDSCHRFNVPRLVFHGMGVLPMLIVKSINSFAACTEKASSIAPEDTVELHSSVEIPFKLQKSDFIDDLWAHGDDKSSEFLAVTSELDEADINSWGVIVNSFVDLEKQYISALENLYAGNAKAWCVGPLLHTCSGEISSHWDPSVAWLDEQSHGGVIYVSFGSTMDPSGPQMHELALGLEMAKVPFIWVVKSTTWRAPEGWEERIRKVGRVCRGWVNQRSILHHRAVGGFLSHCGWNSVLEALTAGVPLLAWPMGAEQPLNAKYVAMSMKAGLMLDAKRGKMPAVVSRTDICAAVRELMEGNEGKRARLKGKELGILARKAMSTGGTSEKKLDELITSLRSI